MSAKLDIFAESGLKFFGKMTASISHEIKNVLAIINENAGLLEDFVLMADRGMAIEPQRLKKMSQTVMKQVRRADTIAKNMHRLAHSVDESVGTVDLNDMLELLVALSNRFASMRGVDVLLKRIEGQINLRTSPFLLMNLLWLCLDYAMDAANEGKTVELVSQKTEAEIQVFFKGLGDAAGASMKPFPSEPEKGLCDLLGAELEIDTDNQEIVVRLTGGISND